MISTTVNLTEAAEAIRIFDQRFGHMEKVAWCLSGASSAELLAKKSGPILPEQVWTVVSWMGLRGVEKAVKTITPKALVEFGWTKEILDETTFSQATEVSAVERVSELVDRMKKKGSRRREVSLSTKVLHWLAPAHFPVFDSYVKKILGAYGERLEAYKQVVEWEFEAARKLADKDLSWMGNAAPRSPLHALDKYLWWKGGGATGNAKVVNDPQRIIRELKIDCSKLE